MTLDPDNWAEVLRTRRLEKGLTIRELSELSEVSASAVHRMEQGYYLLQVDRFLRVIDALDLRPEDVLVFDGRPTSPKDPTLELELRKIAGLDAADALRKLSNLLDFRSDSKMPNPEITVEPKHHRKEGAGNRTVSPTSPSDEFYDALTGDLLVHLVSLAGESGITPPLSAAKIGEPLSDQSLKGKPTRKRIDWLIDNGYISNYAKQGGPRGRQYKIESKARQYLTDHQG